MGKRYPKAQFFYRKNHVFQGNSRAKKNSAYLRTKLRDFSWIICEQNVNKFLDRCLLYRIIKLIPKLKKAKQKRFCDAKLEGLSGKTASCKHSESVAT